MNAEPLELEFNVAVAPERAFATWTERCAMWWPRAHTISGDPAAIVFEPRPGGRILERGPGGDEHAWGQVIEWQPPRRLRYRWHLFFAPEQATDVEVTFVEGRAGGTLVRLKQTGWERLGDAGPPRRARTGTVWAELTAAYAVACCR